MKKSVLTLLISVSFLTGFSQGFAYYPFNSILAVSTNPSNKLWMDLRLQTNSYFSSLSTEFVPLVNLNENKMARFYTGLGIRYNFTVLVEDYRLKPLEGYSLHVGVRSEPFPKLDNLQVAFELSPFAQRDFKVGLFRSYLGLAYYFNKK